MNQTSSPPKILTSRSGMATIESLPLLVLFVVLITYGMGLWGFIHTGILYSISARTYAFETFRNRTNLTYFRENTSGLVEPQTYIDHEVRYHGIQSETSLNAPGDDFRATARPLAFGRNLANLPNRPSATFQDHNTNIYNINGRNRQGGVAVSPAHVMVGYGLCLNSSCGD